VRYISGAIVSRGWWTLGRLRGAPIRLHWSLLLGALIWSRFRFAPVFWLAFAALILLHELGHALVIVRYRLGLSEIALHGAGGHCRHERSGTRFEEGIVAWGGVLAQLTLYVVTQLCASLFGPITSPQLATLHYVFTDINLWVAALNLIPFEPLDGAKAWPVVGSLLARLRRSNPAGGRPRNRRSVQDELRDLERIETRDETTNQKTERIVRDLIARTTQSKDR
jgi:Zn-dependent protease